MHGSEPTREAVQIAVEVEARVAVAVEEDQGWFLGIIGVLDARGVDVELFGG